MGQVQEKSWGMGRIEVIRVWDVVEKMLEEGHSVSSIHRSLQAKNIISITRRQLDRVIRTYKRRYKIPKTLTPSAFSHKSSSRLTRSQTPSSKPQTFRHDPLPSRDYFARGSGS